MLQIVKGTAITLGIACNERGFNGITTLLPIDNDASFVSDAFPLPRAARFPRQNLPVKWVQIRSRSRSRVLRRRCCALAGRGSFVTRTSEKIAGLALAVLSLVVSALVGCAANPTPLSRPALFVSPSGNDAWSGLLAESNADRSDGPLATVQAARDRLRFMRATGSLPAVRFTVYLRAGRYPLRSSVLFTDTDSGLPGAEVTFAAYPGESPLLCGGVVIDALTPLKDANARERIPASGRPHVLQADLRALGVTDFGTITPETGDGVALYFRGRLMSLARYPSRGWLTIASVPQTGPAMLNAGLDRDTSLVPRGRHYGRFTYSGDRPKAWRPRDDIWMYGYWCWDWAGQYLQVARIDTVSREVYPRAPHSVYGYAAGQRFVFLNVLEELDSPGEWYLDFERGNLYFWPPQPPAPGDLVLSMTREPLISIQGGRHIVMRGLSLEAGRGNAVRITESFDCRIEHCLIRNVGQTAVVVDGGSDCAVVGCDIRDVGAGGISLSGGDRQKLLPSRHLARGNHIHDFAQLLRTGQPAIRVAGVGQRVANNLIHDTPHMAVAIAGNDHVLELNEVHHVGQETRDVGAFYMGRDWTERGIIIRWNYFHDLSGPGPNDVNAVYLDDFASGVTVRGNLFVRAGCGVLIGGGRDNVVECNVFVDCNPAVSIDARGLGWARPSALPGGILYKRLEEIDYTSEPWASRYPDLARILFSADPAAPADNTIRLNISRGGRWLAEGPGLPEDAAAVTESFTAGDPGFIDAGRGDYRLRSGSEALKAGFPQVRLEEMGLRGADRKEQWN